LFCEEISLIGKIALKLYAKSNPRHDINFSPNIFIPKYVFGAHCYVISDSGKKKLLEKFNKISGAVDVIFNRLASECMINVYASKSMLASQKVDSENSTISQKHPRLINRILDKVYIAKDVSFSYGFSYPLGRIGTSSVTPFTLTFLVLGIFCGIKLNLYQSFNLMCVIFSADVLVGDTAAINTISIFLLSWWISRLYFRKNK
jgi:hypothetical protein